MTEPIQPTQPTPKLELERETKSPLMVYFFIIHSPELKLKEEKCVAVMAYELETALIRAGQEAKNLSLFYTGQKTPITELISKLHLDNVISPPTSEEQLPEIPQKEMSKQSFIWNLLYAVDNFIEDPEKRQQLKDLLKEIKVEAKNKDK